MQYCILIQIMSEEGDCYCRFIHCTGDQGQVEKILHIWMNVVQLFQSYFGVHLSQELMFGFCAIKCLFVLMIMISRLLLRVLTWCLPAWNELKRWNDSHWSCLCFRDAVNQQKRLQCSGLPPSELHEKHTSALTTPLPPDKRGVCVCVCEQANLITHSGVKAKRWYDNESFIKWEIFIYTAELLAHFHQIFIFFSLNSFSFLVPMVTIAM